MTAMPWPFWAALPPRQAAHLSLSKIRSALKRAGRQRNLDARAHEIAAALRAEQLAAPSAVTAAFAATTRAAVGIIAELNRQVTDLEAELATHFEFPGPLRGRPRMRENRVRSLAEVGVSWRSEPVFEFDPGSRWWGCALLP